VGTANPLRHQGRVKFILIEQRVDERGDDIEQEDLLAGGADRTEVQGKFAFCC